MAARESTPLLVGQVRMPCIERAAWLVEDGIKGLPPRDRSSRTPSARERYLFSEAVRRRGLAIVLTGLMLLGFFEVPLWCLSEGWAQQPFRSLPAKDTCIAPERSQRYISGLPYLPVAIGVLLEAGMYAFILWYVHTQVRWRGLPASRSDVSVVGYAALSAVAGLDAIAFACGGFRASVRLAPFARVGLVVLTEPIKTTFCSTIASAGDFLRVVSLYVGFFLLVAFVLATLLNDDKSPIPECRQLESIEGRSAAAPALDCPTVSDAFETYGNAGWTMALIAACQSLDLTLPSYAAYRQAGLFWLAVFFTMNFVLLNVILATVFDAYNERFKMRVVSKFKYAELGMLEAYDELVAERRLETERMQRTPPSAAPSSRVNSSPTDGAGARELSADSSGAREHVRELDRLKPPQACQDLDR